MSKAISIEILSEIVKTLWSDNKKLLQLTKFKPSISLDDGLKRTIDWFSYDENIKHYK